MTKDDRPILLLNSDDGVLMNGLIAIGFIFCLVLAGCAAKVNFDAAYAAIELAKKRADCK